MPETLDPLDAAEVYTVGIEPRRRTRVGHMVAVALDFWCALSGGLLELTSAADVVVRRRHDDVEELRVETTGPEDAAALVDVVRRQLSELDPEEFRAAWGID